MKLLAAAVIAFAPGSGTSGAASPPLTPDGFGPMRIGMSERLAARTLGLKIAKDDGANSYDCREELWPAHPELVVMARRGRIARISLVEKSPLRTERGLGVGSSEADVRRGYGRALKAEPNAYEEPPALYLTAWAVKGRRGVRYETDNTRRVARLHVGDDSIELIEGCL